MNGSGCKNCPVNHCETTNYRGSICAAQRAKFGLGDPKTNADRILAMSDEELANFSHNLVCKSMCEYCKEYERIKTAKGNANCNGECDKAYLEWLKHPAE